MKELKDTVNGMLSSDWKERLVAEIEQADIRRYKLAEHMTKIGEDSPEYSLLMSQLGHMNDYISDLTARAVAFDIKFELPSIKAIVESGIKNDDTSDCMFLALLLMFLMMSDD